MGIMISHNIIQTNKAYKPDRGSIALDPDLVATDQ